MTMTLLRQGRLIPVPPPEKALRFLEQNGPPAPNQRGGGRRAVIGDPAKVRAGIEEVAEQYGAEEVMVVTITHEHEARRRSYELVAEAFGLQPAADYAVRHNEQPGQDDRQRGPALAGEGPHGHELR
jgi:hypothetical protein